MLHLLLSVAYQMLIHRNVCCPSCFSNRSLQFDVMFCFSTLLKNLLTTPPLWTTFVNKLCGQPTNYPSFSRTSISHPPLPLNQRPILSPNQEETNELFDLCCFTWMARAPGAPCSHGFFQLFQKRRYWPGLKKKITKICNRSSACVSLFFRTDLFLTSSNFFIFFSNFFLTFRKQ